MFFQFLSQGIVLDVFLGKIVKNGMLVIQINRAIWSVSKIEKKIAEDPIILKNPSLNVKKLHIYNIHVYV